MGIPYGRQEITQEDISAVVEVLKGDFLTQGPTIASFEKDFAEFVGCKYAIAVSNGTAALHLGAIALKVEKGTKVITSPITFAASSNSILYCGGDVEFVDIDLSTGLMDLNKLKLKLEGAPAGTYAGVIPVDFAGNPIQSEQLRTIADQHGLWIMEDACHAPGGYFVDSKGSKEFCGAGQYSNLTVFSFHPVKHIACGEGGMITTNDESLYQKLEMLRTHGITKRPDLLEQNDGGWYYEMHELGYNYRLTDIQAALGIEQLKKQEAGLKRRRQIAQVYNTAFGEAKIKSLDTSVEGHAFHLYVILVEDRKGLYEHLRSKEIYAQVHYIPVHLQPYYAKLGWSKGDFPNAEAYYGECLSLPMFPSLSDKEQQFVIDCVLEFVQQ